jgi:spore germination protein YaaH
MKRSGIVLVLGALALALVGVAGAKMARSLTHHAARPAKAAERGPPFVGFYVGWDDNARTSLSRHVGGIDAFSPMWVTVRGASAELVPEDDPDTQALLAGRKAPPRVMPMVSNAHDDIWDAKSAEATILDPDVRSRVNQGLADFARERRLSGYIFDFETLTPRAAAGFPAFLRAERAALGPKGLKIWAVAPTDPEAPLADLAASADAIVVMAYDECWASSNPGPVAGADWVQAILAKRLSGIDPKKVVVGLASYGYDWPKGSNAKVISAPAALALAAAKGAPIRRDPASSSAWFAYTDDNGHGHEVWLVDAAAFALQRDIAASFKPAGIALWRLGLEDPGLWSKSVPRLPRPARPAPGAPLPHPCDPLHLPPG